MVGHHTRRWGLRVNAVFRQEFGFTVSGMLANGGTYAPCILRGRMHWQAPAGERNCAGHYRLAGVLDGVHRVAVEGRDLRVPAGGLYLMRPGQTVTVAAHGSSRAVLLAFTVISCPLQRAADGALVPVDPEHRQPPPEAVWGVDLPFLLPTRLARRLLPVLTEAVSLYWLDERRRFQANMRLCSLLECLVEDQPASPGAEAGLLHGADWLPRLHRLLRERLPLLRGSADLAAALGVSADHLNRRCKAVTGETAAACLRRTRLEQTEHLLRTTDLPLAALAARVGYRSVTALHQAWATRHEVPPLRWRRLRH